jgi:hypothetical protein
MGLNFSVAELSHQDGTISHFYPPWQPALDEEKPEIAFLDEAKKWKYEAMLVPPPTMVTILHCHWLFGETDIASIASDVAHCTLLEEYDSSASTADSELNEAPFYMRDDVEHLRSFSFQFECRRA